MTTTKVLYELGDDDSFERHDYVLPPTEAHDEIQHNIDQLTLWMRDHQPQSDWTPHAWQAYGDRLDALARWIGCAQRRALKGGAR